jgi:hypothetical protein
MSQPKVNFIHLGPSKSGSTWLHEILISHPEVYLTQAKDLYFFNRYYDRGRDWYLAQFRDARPEQKIVGEICPDYLSEPDCPERIHACLGSEVRLMVTLREPVARAFSGYLYLDKHGLAAPTFRETMRTAPELLEEGRYATHLRRYLKYFDRESIHIGLFDDLQADPQAFLDETTGWLGVGRQVVSQDDLEARLPASKARFLPLAALAKHGANWVRKRDGADLVGRIKRSSLVQKALYTPLTGAAKPTMTPEDVAFVRGQLEDEIAAIEDEFGIPLRERWGWP